MQAPLVIGHRGDSAHRPEHTAAAYRSAWRVGADSVEPDVVMTRDGVLVCRHDLELSLTTDVAERPDLAERRRDVVVDGHLESGWFVHDLDLAELRTLRARERWPRRRPGSARFDGHFGVVTLDELLTLRARESARLGRTLGVHVELKHGPFYAERGTPLDEPLVDLLRQHRLTSALAPLSVMSFDHGLLRRLRRQVDVELVVLLDKDDRGRDKHVRRGALRRHAAYADAVALHQELVLPRAADGRVVGVGPALERAQAAGLDVLVWTVRHENHWLPLQLRRGTRGRDHGDGEQLVRWLLELGVDGVLTDFPELADGVRRQRRSTARAS
ncbi:glycerophosphodiester phosphodiesterase family protein [Nocardioides marmoraquaticus]